MFMAKLTAVEKLYKDVILKPLGIKTSNLETWVDKTISKETDDFEAETYITKSAYLYLIVSIIQYSNGSKLTIAVLYNPYTGGFSIATVDYTNDKGKRYYFDLYDNKNILNISKSTQKIKQLAKKVFNDLIKNGYK